MHGLNIVFQAPDSSLGNECIKYDVINRNCWHKKKITFLFIAANLSYRVGWGHSSTVLEEDRKWNSAMADCSVNTQHE